MKSTHILSDKANLSLTQGYYRSFLMIHAIWFTIYALLRNLL